MQCIKHEAGLKDYLNKYHKELIKCYSNKLDYPNPINPEDFLVYADKDVLDKNQIGKRNYNNLDILLVSLSLKYHYNMKTNKKLSYNDILDLYLINKLKLKSTKTGLYGRTLLTFAHPHYSKKAIENP